MKSPTLRPPAHTVILLYRYMPPAILFTHKYGKFAVKFASADDSSGALHRSQFIKGKKKALLFHHADGDHGLSRRTMQTILALFSREA